MFIERQIRVLERFLKDHVILKTGEIQHCIAGIHFKDVQIHFNILTSKTMILNYNNIKNNAIGNNRSQLKVSTVIDKQLCVCSHA